MTRGVNKVHLHTSNVHNSTILNKEGNNIKAIRHKIAPEATMEPTTNSGKHAYCSTESLTNNRFQASPSQSAVQIVASLTSSKTIDAAGIAHFVFTVCASSLLTYTCWKTDITTGALFVKNKESQSALCSEESSVRSLL
ncbi:hypothetical protein Mapa_016047 [Marchantia paleacea]|nr:hypothetical protein Mapa_016047 [Marchantia paleacea]